jgi:hypothetical protein
MDDSFFDLTNGRGTDCGRNVALNRSKPSRGQRYTIIEIQSVSTGIGCSEVTVDIECA